MSKKETRDFYKNLKTEYAVAFKNEFIDLICNAVTVEGLPDGVPPYYVIRKLLENGKIGIYNNELWLPVSASGNVNIYGVPVNYTVIGENGVTFTGNNDLIKVIRLNPSGRSIMSWLNLKCLRLAEIEISINANLQANRDTVLMLVDTEKNAETLKNAWLDREIGLPAIAVNNGFQDAFKVIKTDANYIVNELQECKKNERNEVLTRLGIITGNADKKERVESFELPVNEAIDSIYVFIDTFNKDAEAQNITARMKLNGSIEELYNEENEGVKNETNV